MLAVMPLNETVPSVGDLSSAVFAGQIGGQDCRVLMPRLPTKGWKVAPPTSADDWSQYGGVWGGASFGVQGKGLFVRTLGLDFPTIDNDQPGADRLKSRVMSAGIGWLDRLHEWLAVLHGEPAASIYIEPPLMFLEYDPEVGPLDMHEPQARVSIATWRDAIAHASQFDEAPLAVVLLHRSAKSFFEADYRLAVINAATAVELAISQAVRRVLGPDAAEAVLGQVRMLGPRIEIAHKLGVPIPAPASFPLLELRNRVIHRGERPSRNEVSNALQQVVELFRALPDSDLGTEGISKN